MLGHLSKRSVASRILHVNHHSSAPTLKVTIFGASSQIAHSISEPLGKLQSQIFFPVRTSDKWVDHLKVSTVYKNISIRGYIDYDDPDIFDRLIEDSNVVINLTGAHKYIKDPEVVYDSNVTFSRRLAQAVARNPDVLRLIHFSAVGADPDSNSNWLRTKWIGEQEVKAAFPGATVFRPATIFGEFDNFVMRIGLLQSWLGFVPVIDDAKELRQPIYGHDLGTAVMNALKMPETVGKTYELGGPHVYSMKEICEIVYNKIGKPPVLRSIPYKTASRFFSYFPHAHGFTRFMSIHDVHESKIDLVVSEDALKISDLYVKPVSFSQNLKRILVDYVAKTDLTGDEQEHGWYNGHDRHYEP